MGTSIKTTNPRKNLFSHLKYEYLAAGVAGGTVSTLALHPLDLLKVRFAVNDGQVQYRQYSGAWKAFVQIVKKEGYTGLYRGITPNVLGSATSWGSYFFLYNCIKTWIQNGNTEEPLGLWMHMLAASESGILTLLVTNPIWVIKTRLCLQYAEDRYLPESKQYSGMIDALKKIVTHEGFRGLYKGFVPGLFGVSHGAIQFMAYEEMKVRYNLYKFKPINSKLGTVEYITCAAISKLFAAVLTYPYQVVRARLQDHHHNYKGTMHCIECIWRLEGFRGFYKGIAPYFLHVLPNVCLIYFIYESVSDFTEKK